MADHESVAVQAYRLWEEHGRPAGRELEFWVAAEAEVARQAGTPSPADGPPVTNLDRALSPAERQRVRAERAGENRERHEAEARPPAHFIVTLDRAHLRIYHLQNNDRSGRAQFELAESFDIPAGRKQYTEIYTDQAGRFRVRIGPAGASVDERLPMQMEQEHRLIAELADHVERFLEEHREATWDYSAGPALHQAVLDRLAPNVRSRLEVALVKELIHQSPAQLRAYFIS